MKKTYLGPKSETLSAILKDMCGAIDDPATFGNGSPTSTTDNNERFAPRATHAV